MNDIQSSAPLRLTGGADTSFGSQEDFQSISSQDRFINEDTGVSQVLVENSMSEQDIKDVLLDAGYSIDEIDNVLSLKAKTDMTDLGDISLSDILYQWLSTLRNAKKDPVNQRSKITLVLCNNGTESMYGYGRAARQGVNTVYDLRRKTPQTYTVVVLS